MYENWGKSFFCPVDKITMSPHIEWCIGIGPGLPNNCLQIYQMVPKVYALSRSNFEVGDTKDLLHFNAQNWAPGALISIPIYCGSVAQWISVRLFFKDTGSMPTGDNNTFLLDFLKIVCYTVWNKNSRSSFTFYYKTYENILKISWFSAHRSFKVYCSYLKHTFAAVQKHYTPCNIKEVYISRVITRPHFTFIIILILKRDWTIYILII